MGKGPAFAPLTLKDYIRQIRPIPGGTFRMGSNHGEDDEKPVHLVRLSRFRMGSTPVTVGMWIEYCAATGSRMPTTPKWGWNPTHPMVGLSWEDIQGQEGGGGYCQWASRKSGMRLQLPTEAQFEYCARDGGKNIVYPWGNRFDRARLWCSKEYGDAERTSPVVREDRIYVNSLGLSDMAGNVWQWCRDGYGEYPPGPVTDPMMPASDDFRRQRGVGWYGYKPDIFRCAHREAMPASVRSYDYGFRLSSPRS